ncbi:MULTISPECIES: TldD/PmbA family protein [unclassified Novosphingobium]|uniref:TldD/PmbA family protein n=1 Tax=unclassified Novosphingobium TaxID=2644732 RepID=UPI0025E6B8FC|nr:MULTISPECIES: TldD/PmbA family protein [unclassified Novosphingobium]HQV03264.1 TldD/PmbA family protein [Novosphingobium sp.]
MLSPTAAQDRAAALIDFARAAGADAADAVYSGSSSESVSVRLGALEDVERSESEHLDLRVFVGRRSASIGSSDLSDAALKELAARAVDMARAAPEDQYAGLADAALLAKGPFPDLDSLDPAELSPAQLRERALEIEDAARAVAGVTNSEGGHASLSQRNFALVTSHGFAGSFGGTMHGISATAIAGEGGNMQRDYAWRMARHLADMPGLEELGRLAGERAVRRLDPGRVKSGPMPVVFDPRVGGTLISHLSGAISGNAIARRSSFLLEMAGEQVFAPSITIHDDPLLVRGLSSRPFDGEGLATAPRALVEAGRLTGWLMDSAAARQLGAAPTGHAVRGAGGSPGVSTSNVQLAPGSATVAELIADIEEGVFVNELIGHGVNGVTGDYSRGASGYRIVRGEIAGPVAEFTVAGNLIDMFARMSVANDLEWHRTINVPTLRIDGMTIAGD